MDKEGLFSIPVGTRPGKSSKHGTPRGKKGGITEPKFPPSRNIPLYRDTKKKKKTRIDDYDDDEINDDSYDGGNNNFGKRNEFFNLTNDFYTKCSGMTLTVPTKSTQYEDNENEEEDAEINEHNEKEESVINEKPLENINNVQKSVKEEEEEVEEEEEDSQSSSSSSSNYDGSPQIYLGSSNFAQDTQLIGKGVIDVYGTNIRFQNKSQDNLYRSTWKQNIEELYRLKRDNRSLNILRVCKEQDKIASFNSYKKNNFMKYNNIFNQNFDNNNNNNDDDDDDKFNVVNVNLDGWLVAVINEQLQMLVDDDDDDDDDDGSEIEDGEIINSDYDSSDNSDNSDDNDDDDDKEVFSPETIEDQFDSLSL